jgi:hypothetical protein
MSAFSRAQYAFLGRAIITDLSGNNPTTLYKVAPNGMVSVLTTVGGGPINGGYGSLVSAVGLAFDNLSGNLYVSLANGMGPQTSLIVGVAPDGMVTPLGVGEPGGEGFVQLPSSSDLAIDSIGNLYFDVSGGSDNVIDKYAPPSTERMIFTAPNQQGFEVGEIAAVAGSASGTLSGSTTVGFDNGVATFTGLSLNPVGNYTLTLSSSGFDVNELTSATTGIINVTPTPTRLAVTGVPPASVQAGAGFGLAVAAEDTFGNVAPSFSGPVSIAIAAGPAGSALDGAGAVTAVNGVATFSGLSLSPPGHYTLAVSTSGLTGATTNCITVAPATPAGTTPALGIFATGSDAGGGPQVQVYNALCGALLYSFFAYDPNLTSGIRVAVGDVNGDGVPDLITAPGPGGGPEVKVFDGATGQLMRDFFAYAPAFSGGVYVAAGDTTGDGFDDIICGADAGGGPNVTVFSGKDGSVLQNFFACSPYFTGGVRVAAGDVTGAGVADIICGAGPGGGPNVSVFSGQTGALLASFFAYGENFSLGIYVSAGDITGTGRAAVITGAGAGGGPNVSAFQLNGGAVSLLLNFFPYDPAFTGGVRVAAVDRSGNGTADLLTVAGVGGGPDVATFDPTGHQVDQFFAYDPLFADGLYVAGG